MPKPKKTPLRALRVKRTAMATDANGLSTLATLATGSFERVERELRAESAQLHAQMQRYQVAFNGIAQGICIFDPEDRVVLSNRRYAEIYRLAPEQVRPGMTLREIVELRIAAGTCATANADAYLSFCASNNAAKAGMFWSVPLRDGRTIQVRHQPLPNGDWVSTHEDITELSAARASANQRLSAASSHRLGARPPLGQGYREPLCRRKQSVGRRQRPCDAKRYDRTDRFRSPFSQKQHRNFARLSRRSSLAAIR